MSEQTKTVKDTALEARINFLRLWIMLMALFSLIGFGLGLEPFKENEYIQQASGYSIAMLMIIFVFGLMTYLVLQNSKGNGKSYQFYQGFMALASILALVFFIGANLVKGSAGLMPELSKNNDNTVQATKDENKGIPSLFETMDNIKKKLAE